jgi:hypothetical protein
VARTVVGRMGENMGQQFLVDNRGGGSANIGMELAAKAAPDGYTIIMASSSPAINPSLFINTDAATFQPMMTGHFMSLLGLRTGGKLTSGVCGIHACRYSAVRQNNLRCRHPARMISRLRPGARRLPIIEPLHIADTIPREKE